MQGARHLIWYMITIEATKMRPYLNLIKDKEVVISTTRQSCPVMKETLDKRSAKTYQNTINFLNTLSKEEMKTMGIKDRITIIIWARKVIRNHHHVESVQAKDDQML